MVRRRRSISTVIAGLLIVAGCTNAAATPSASLVAVGPTASVPATPAESAAPATSTPQPSAQPASPSPPALDQAWATAELVDVATGQPFRIADHAGTVIVVETMAIWCSNCLAQQREVQAALEQLAAESVVYVVLDVDPNEDGPSLALYRERNGFDGRYAIAGGNVARSLAAEFGDQFLNPVATPMLVIATDGTVTPTEFGPKPADEVVDLVRAAEA